MRWDSFLGLLALLGVLLPSWAFMPQTRNQGGALPTRAMRPQDTEACEALWSCRGGAVVSKAAKQKGRTTVYQKSGLLGRIFGRAKEFIRAYFDSLIDPTFESNLATPTRSLSESAARRKKRGGRRFGTISSLPPEPKG